MFTPLTITMTCPFDIERMPFQLAGSVVSMAVECTDHQAE
jgi:hypothetical protein